MQHEPVLKNNENLEPGNDDNGSPLFGSCISCQQYAELEAGGDYCHKCFAVFLNEINRLYLE